MKQALVSVGAALVSALSIFAWFCTAPTSGSGWLLCVAFIGVLLLFASLFSDALSVLGSLARHAVQFFRELRCALRNVFFGGRRAWETIGAVIVLIVSACVWCLNQNSPAAGWVLAITFISALRVLISCYVMLWQEVTVPKGGENRPAPARWLLF